MNPIDKTAPSQTDSISFEFDLPHSPEKVWRALTDPVLLAEWLLPVIDLEARAGRGVHVQDAAASRVGRHRELPDPRDRRAQEAQLHVGRRRHGMDTVVTFTLTPTASGTRLSLVQSGFKPEQKQNFGGARYGWKMMGGKLVDLLARIP